MNYEQLKVGQRVYFGRVYGEKTLGEVVKINRVKVKVRQLESRGTFRSHKVGTIWTVPPSLLSEADATAVPVIEDNPVTAARPYLVNVFTGKRTYGRPGEDPEMIYNRMAAFGNED